MAQTTLLPILARLALALAIVASAGACSAQSPAVKAGVCVEKETLDAGNRVPDLSSIARCTTPHVYEIYDVVDLPREALIPAAGPGWMDVRDDLALPRMKAPDTAHRRAFDAFSQRRCGQSLLRATGYDALTINGKSATRVELLPAMRGVTPRYTVAPEQQWRDGQREVLCSVRMSAPVQAQEDPSAREDVLLLQTARSGAFPLALRACRAYDQERRNVVNVACSQRHVTESLFVFDAEKAMGTKFVRNLISNPTPKNFDRLDAVCTQALPQLLGRKFDRKLRGFGSVTRRWTATSKPVRCDVGAIEFRTLDLPPGSLVGTHGIDVKLLPRR